MSLDENWPFYILLRVLHRPPRRTTRRASSAAPLTTSRTMRSTTSKLIFVAVAFAAVFARGADAAADAA